MDIDESLDMLRRLDEEIHALEQKKIDVLNEMGDDCPIDIIDQEFHRLKELFSKDELRDLKNLLDNI